MVHKQLQYKSDFTSRPASAAVYSQLTKQWSANLFVSSNALPTWCEATAATPTHHTDAHT